MESKIFEYVSKELNIGLKQIEETMKLYDDGATIPFISRYRKEVTGNLDEEQIRDVVEKITYYRNLEKRKEEVIRLIEEQGALTPELEKSINDAMVLQRVEDLYMPYKKKKKTKADIAIENGLEPLSIFAKDEKVTMDALREEATKYINENVSDVDAALEGVHLIYAQKLSEEVANREYFRKLLAEKSLVVSKLIEKNKDLDEKQVYKDYYNFSEAYSKIVTHRILAVNRGENEKILKVNLEIDEVTREELVNHIYKMNFNNVNLKAFFITVINDAIDRLMYPSIENELRNILTEKAELEAIENFATNLEGLLLQPPLNKKTILGLDPGYRTGAKLAIIDKDGFFQESDVVYLVKDMHTDKQLETAKSKILKYLRKYDVDIVAIGNGTASRETESFVAALLKEYKEKKVSYIIVNEAGASVYSASKVAAEEFPELDVTVRGTISISRRLQDPLAELVKIDPKSIGVGMYQHDVNQKKLNEELEQTIEKIVNRVGVNINTASAELLGFVSGIKKNIAKNIVEYRKENGDFKNRKEILKVKGLGAKAFEQLAGFVVIPNGENPLDNTIIHPESYHIAEEILASSETKVEDLKTDLEAVREKLKSINLQNIIEKTGLDKTTKDVYEALIKDRRDPRDDFDKPLLREDVLSIEDLKAGMELEGTVRNVTKFGAFVDIGLKNDAMIHISELSDSFVDDPTKVLSIGQIIKVRVLDVDMQRGRVGLTRRDPNYVKPNKNSKENKKKQQKVNKEEIQRRKLEQQLINKGWKIKK
ncbi:RNA-binding transcriptional accessory protein [Streptobacillus felis]|uniref:RNA-binding transcriptional accessory protein n=1 Tax=Streptobacillus felis TaxID=1384509 RepID=A0A7Z0PFD2_9FUSO|nr:Tex family protein [Streptobacillus felis]NYV27542.1 RNA-binding transcriptional accessory protein [Streptobacillus felis]